jgi:hypothetical protein
VKGFPYRRRTVTIEDSETSTQIDVKLWDTKADVAINMEPGNEMIIENVTTSTFGNIVSLNLTATTHATEEIVEHKKQRNLLPNTTHYSKVKVHIF